MEEIAKIEKNVGDTGDLIRFQFEKENEIVQIIDQVYKGMNVRLMGGLGTTQKPYHIVILDNAFENDELITARFGEIYSPMNNTYLIQKIAQKLVENGVQNFALYGIEKYTNYGIKEN